VLGLPLIVITVLVSFIVVRLGAIALELTGLEPATANFQALSAFTGTGFTTREAELVVRHPQRRRILQVLMVAGNAGLVTVIAGLVQALQVRVPPKVLIFQLAGLVVAFHLLYVVVVSPRLNRWLSNQLRQRLQRYVHFEPVHFEELLEEQEGWGVFRVVVNEHMPCAGKSLAKTGLRDHGITVLFIERGGTRIPAPGGDDPILVGDTIIVWGPLAELEALLGRYGAPLSAAPTQHGAPAETAAPNAQEHQAGRPVS
jgi:hypothetical protein